MGHRQAKGANRTKGVSLALILPQNAIFILFCSESKIRLQGHAEQLICFAYW
jgi:hypothetical protein